MNDTLRGALKSKTIWFNAFVGAVTLADQYGGMVSAVIPHAAPFITGFAVIGNAILRVLTSTSLANK